MRSIGLALITMTLIVGCSKDGKSPAFNEIVIGEYASMTGSTATFGQSTHKGIQLALDEVNAVGLLGKKVKIITEDDQGKPEQAVNAVLKLIQRDHVVAVLGEVASSCSIAAAPVCQQNRIPMLSPSSTNPDVTKKGDFIFRACFIDPFQGLVMAKFATTTLKVKTAAIFADQRQDYSVGLAQFFKETFTRLGGQVVAEESYQTNDKEFRPQLINIRRAKPDVIFVPGYYTECALIAKQARELGITQPFLGGDGWDSEVTLQSGGAAVNGSYFSTHYSPDDPQPEVQHFVTKYRQRYGTTPDAMAVTGYDAAHLLFDAMKRAGSTSPETVCKALAATRDFPGVSGKITIDENRNARKDAVVLKIENGKFNFAERIAP